MAKEDSPRGTEKGELGGALARIEMLAERVQKLEGEVIGNGGDGLKLKVDRLSVELQQLRRLAKVGTGFVSAMTLTICLDFFFKLTGVAYGGYMEEFREMTKRAAENNDLLNEIKSELKKK